MGLGKFSVEKKNEAVIQGFYTSVYIISFKVAKRKLGIVRVQIFAVRKPDGEITYNRKDLVKVVDDF